MEGPDGVWLRKINHVKTIRGTTAIEGNTLTKEQVTAVLAGKRVAAPRREIDEIKGAHAAYGLLKKVDPLFYAAPVENIVFSNQEKYYRAINESTAKVDCGPFIDFMLERILKKREMADTLRFPEG